MVNYYQDRWIQRSHLLSPITKQTFKEAKWQWTETEQMAFDAIWEVIGQEVLLAYLDFNTVFNIHKDTSHTQLGTIISQDGKPIAFYG